MTGQRNKKIRLKVKKGNSPIHGIGLFAVESIEKGEKIGDFEIQKTRQDGKHVLWIWEDEKQVPYKVTNVLKFANHSSNPNSEVLGIEMFALEFIHEGTEITFHYGEEWT